MDSPKCTKSYFVEPRGSQNDFEQVLSGYYDTIRSKKYICHTLTLMQIQKEDGTGKEYPLGATLEATKNTLIQDSIKLLLDFRVVFLSRVGIDIEAKRNDD
ncbi:unnamed protein product [Lactuca virosa]|uniref:Uncharacterized protein n=1 Tax=Lactuca virosa TaxID=75947 RepID=A0AAU9PQC8_9ASTR|nr:unnamed protein product [Lactuca virosa]